MEQKAMSFLFALKVLKLVEDGRSCSKYTCKGAFIVALGLFEYNFF